jgi:hydrogenase small subunit
MTPIYRRMPNVSGFGVERTADTIGAALAVGATAGVAAHAIATGMHRLRHRKARVSGEGTGSATEHDHGHE